MVFFEQAWSALRMGDDMRFKDWPLGDFVRMSEGVPTSPAGYQVSQYFPSELELYEPKWRRA
jgi:hypothetical protein